MQSQCPHCLTIFNITEAHLELAGGDVRCAQCQTVFNGHAQLVEEKPAPPALTDIAVPAPDVDVHIDAQSDLPFDSEGLDERALLDDSSAPTNSNKAGPNTLIYSDLLIESQPKRKRWLLNSLLLLLCLALTATLLLQIVYLKRQELVHHPVLGTYIQQACDLVPACHLQEIRALDQFYIESRRVYAHPNVKNALVMSATFRNGASFKQAFPALLVSMSNVRGQEVASRLFQPADYLDSFTNIDNGVAANQSVSISLKLADPGNDALAFEIAFH